MFNGDNLSEYQGKIFNQFTSDVESIDHSEFLELNIEDEVNQRLKRFYIKIPELNSENIEVAIIGNKIKGENLPAGRTFTIGSVIHYEYVEYKIPITGSDKIFSLKPIPSINHNLLNVCKITGKNIVVQMTDFNKISVNDKMIEVFKNQLGTVLKEINRVLESSKDPIDEMHEDLSEMCIRHLDKLVKAAKLKQDSIDKLKP